MKMAKKDIKDNQQKKKTKKKYLAGLAGLLLGAGIITGGTIGGIKSKKRATRRNKKTTIDLDQAINQQFRYIPTTYTENQKVVIDHINKIINKLNNYKKPVNIKINDLELIFSKETNSVKIVAKPNHKKYKGQVELEFRSKIRISDLIANINIADKFETKPDKETVIKVIKEQNPELQDFDFENNLMIEITDDKIIITPISDNYQDKIEIKLDLKDRSEISKPESDETPIYTDITQTELKEIGYFKNSAGQYQIKPIPITVKKVPDKLPDFITNLKGAFEGNVNQNISGLENWDTSNVTNMIDMFKDAKNFNQPLDNFKTSNLVDMGRMFSGASAFNQDISSWNTSRVQNMGELFKNASAFNQDISAWDTSRVTDMNSMFNGASAFNQNLSEWDVNKVIYWKDFNKNAHYQFKDKKIPEKFTTISR
ncbi:BspA family leucine-rich repeat surface protein [Mycoplasma putrefaciens]|uniref:PARCEL domain protein n=1 Tax=Mycoplasma putrefaciens (strain ATCC 15718 / NCTC 10155 / C30 KS-1 / KS-1) TaxID=743965 RepID=A0A7U3ZSM4_MYCPK|nr:PARCEL domain protein [Mycoplasma putrefaciens KS1]